MYVLPWGLTLGPIYHSNSLVSYILPSISLCHTHNNKDNKIETKNRNLNNNSSNERVHKPDIISILIGSLLGDLYAERRGPSTRFAIKQSDTHKEYIYYLHNILYKEGYCSSNIQKGTTTASNKSLKRYTYYRFKTYSFSSLNWIYDLFYINGIKIVPLNISEYLTPLALAIWIMDDGSKSQSGGLILSTEGFDKTSIDLLCSVLSNKYGLTVTTPKNGVNRQGNSRYRIYVSANSMLKLRSIIKPYIIPSMSYKIDKF